MKIGFTGHRDKVAHELSLLNIERRYPGATWVHGGAEGFDSQVDALARKLGKVEGDTLLVILPNYRKFKSTVAPLIRNEQIVGMSDLLVALWDGRKKGGTFYTINYAKRCNIPVEYITPLGA